LVTVYRTLDLYDELGLVSRVHLPEGCHGYVATTPGHRHVLVCQRCGRSVEFPGREDLDALVADLERQTGYQVCGHLLQLFGVCPECSRTGR
jgi:Fur family transcriptional regulator, ferric uptake regulator